VWTAVSRRSRRHVADVLVGPGLSGSRSRALTRNPRQSPALLLQAQKHPTVRVRQKSKLTRGASRGRTRPWTGIKASIRSKPECHAARRPSDTPSVVSDHSAEAPRIDGKLAGTSE